MIEYGDRYYAPDGAPRLVLHRDCGHPIVEQLTCTRCATTIDPADIITTAGPGAPPAAA